jgi:hypothetical protein
MENTMQAENFYDGKWRPVLDLSSEAMNKLHMRGFEFGADDRGHMMARWPIDPEPHALTFSGIPLEYWQEEVRLHCAASLLRLQSICQARGADYDKTIAGLR